MRVLIAPSNIANQASLHASALRARGHEAEFWQFGEPAFGYAFDQRREWPATASEALALFGEVAAAQYDVIHFHFARSLVNNRNPLGGLWDLALWRRLNVRVIMSLHGTDMRDADRERALDPWSYYHFGAPHNKPAVLARRMGAIRANVDAITLSNGSNFAHVPDANYLPLAVDTDAIQPSRAPAREVPVIVHAPSRRSTKGTDFILASLSSLKEQGVRFDLDLVESVDNAEAIRRMANADIVIEKVLGDGYGVTALEAFAAGRVVVTRTTERATAVAPGFPGVAADPDTLAATLRDLIESPARRAEIGMKSRQFVVEHHGLDVVGATLERLYTAADVVPPAVSHDPEATALREQIAHLRTQLVAQRRATKAAAANANVNEKGRARSEVRRSAAYRARRKLYRMFGRKVG